MAFRLGLEIIRQLLDIWRCGGQREAMLRQRNSRSIGTALKNRTSRRKSK